MRRSLRRSFSATLALLLVTAPPLALAQPAPPPPAATHSDHPHTATTRPPDSRPPDTHTAVRHDTTPSHDRQDRPLAPGQDTRAPNLWAPHANEGDQRPNQGPQSFDQQRNYPGGQPWHDGDRYDGRRDVVNNWQDYHMRPPPQGYEYVRNGDQIVLIAIASGVIAGILANALSH